MFESSINRNVTNLDCKMDLKTIWQHAKMTGVAVQMQHALLIGGPSAKQGNATEHLDHRSLMIQYRNEYKLQRRSIGK